MMDQRVAHFEPDKLIMIDFVEGVAYINLSGDVVYEMSKREVNTHVLGVIMAQQFSLNVGLKKFGKKGKKAVTKELKQLHNMVT